MLMVMILLLPSSLETEYSTQPCDQLLMGQYPLTFLTHCLQFQLSRLLDSEPTYRKYDRLKAEAKRA